MVSPIYFGEVTSQIKVFIDRTFSYLVPDYVANPNCSRLSPGKKLVFIQTQASPDESRFADVFHRYAYFFKWYGFEENYLIRACGVRESGVKKRKSYEAGRGDSEKDFGLNRKWFFVPCIVKATQGEYRMKVDCLDTP